MPDCYFSMQKRLFYLKTKKCHAKSHSKAMQRSLVINEDEASRHLISPSTSYLIHPVMLLKFILFLIYIQNKFDSKMLQMIAVRKTPNRKDGQRSTQLLSTYLDCMQKRPSHLVKFPLTDLKSNSQLTCV